MGDTHQYDCELADGLSWRVTAMGQPTCDVGQAVQLVINAADVKVLTE
ncbi:MAG: hypothetical protein ACYTFO_07680 [Planctomycetota bacterium]